MPLIQKLKHWLKRKRLDPGFLVVLAIALIAVWPFMSRASLPQETDAELHVFRLAELSYLVRGGEFYPRWAPNFFHGYGYPIFNYYAPLTYYLGLPVELMPRLDAVAGVKFVFILGLLLAAVGTYSFVRDRWGRMAGYVATAVYLYAPYVQYIDPHARGVLAESFSLGLFPLALWSLDRLRRRATTWRWLTAVLLVAAVILSHNLMALLFFALFGAWAVWEWGLRRRYGQAETESAGLPFVFAALLLGLALSAFFWLPVALERNAVNLTTLIGAGDNYDFHTHFLTVRELLASTPRLDWGASAPAFRFNLGAAQWVLGGVGLLWLLIWGGARQRARAAFFALALLMLLFLMLPASTVVWETIPLLPYFQFPWRLLGAAAFMLAALAGAGTAVFQTRFALQGKKAALLPALFVAAPLLLGLPLSQPAPWPDFGPVTLARLSEIEHKGRWLGTTSTADYVPATVDMAPKPKPEMEAAFFRGEPPDRVNRATLPEGATVAGEEIRPLHLHYTVDAPKAFPLRLFLFDFPGWRAEVDGKPVETELARPEGFIVVPVPAGEHVVDVHFGSTPPRALAWAISALALLATAALAWRIDRSPSPFPHSPGADYRFRFTDRLTLALVLGITAVFLLILQPSGILRHYSQGDTVEVAQEQIFADFGGQIALIGFDASARRVEPGDAIDVTLYWKAQHALEINYQPFVHVLAADGALVAQSDKLNPGDFPTRRWGTEKYVRDRHTITAPSRLAPGAYTVTTGLWVAAEGWRLPLLDATGEQIGDNVPLFTLEVGETAH